MEDRDSNSDLSFHRFEREDQKNGFNFVVDDFNFVVDAESGQSDLSKFVSFKCAHQLLQRLLPRNLGRRTLLFMQGCVCLVVCASNYS
jgi:hypothetical protein